MSTDTTTDTTTTTTAEAPALPPFPGVHFDIPTERVFLSEFYQRVETQDEAFVKRLVARWDDRLFGEIKCSARPDHQGDGQEWYACIDGGHRLAAAVIKGYAVVPAEVLYGLSEREEAQLCLATNTQRRGFGAYDRWLVERNLGNPAILELEGVLKKHRLVAVPARRHGEQRGVKALTALRSAHARTDAAAIDASLQALLLTWGTGKLTGDFIKALAVFFFRYDQVHPRELAEQLRKVETDQLELLIRQAGRSGGGVHSANVLQVIRRVYNDGRTPEAKLR